MTGTISCILVEERWCESIRLLYKTSSYTTPPQNVTADMSPSQFCQSLFKLLWASGDTGYYALPLLWHHQSASHQPSRSRLLTLNVLLYKLVKISVRVYWLKHRRDSNKIPDSRASPKSSGILNHKSLGTQHKAIAVSKDGIWHLCQS
jgi:hypothetical protein